MDKYIGKRLDGRYEMLEIIGVGGMAVVYKARDVLDDRVVAVKVLKNEYMDNEDFKRRFKNECKAIAVLSHPNIVKVYDVNFGGNIEYIVMEYIDGITLKQYLEQQKVLPWKEALHYITQVLQALQHAHDKGIIHRDIKPQNIMLLRDSTIKVMDFGIARFSRNTTHTINTAQAIGSVHYISPEQASGDLTDEKTDIYSVGVMLYELLTGKLPFEAETAVSVAIMQLQSTPRSPREINSNIPEGLEEITMHAMQKEQTKRYQSAAAMLRDIDDFKRNPSIHFEYKYFVDDHPTRVVQSIEQIHTGERMAALGEFDPEKDEKRHSAIPLLACIAFGAVLFIVAFVVIVMWWTGFFTSQKPSNTIDVPSVIGKTVAQAESEYGDFNFIVGNTEYNMAEEGLIIRQSPEDGKKAEKGDAITVVVSLGPRENTVPNISGYSLDEARAVLDKLELKYEISEREDNETAAGCVIQTYPSIGSSIYNQDTIIVYVSLGPSEIPVEVPKVIGISEANAKRLLEAKGLKVGESILVDSDQPINQVISCSPTEGHTVNIGTTVILTISNGKKPTKEINLPVPMPKTDTPVYLRVYVDGLERNDLRTSAIIPSQRPQHTFFISGSGKANVTVQISASTDGGFADYYVCTIDFDKEIITDYRQLSFKDPNGDSSSQESSQPSGGEDGPAGGNPD